MIIYQITNNINGKSYIGQTIKTLEKRIKVHCRKDSQCTALKNAINKYGIENFSAKIIVHCENIEEANYYERRCIEQFSTLAPNGYNLKTGGDRWTISEETRSRLSKAISGRTMSIDARLKISNSLKGRHISNELRAKFSAVHKGRKHTVETKDKISQAAKGKIYPHMIENARKMGLNNKGKAAWNKGIVKIKTV